MKRAQAGALGTVLKEGGESKKEKQRCGINNEGKPYDRALTHEAADTLFQYQDNNNYSFG